MLQEISAAEALSIVMGPDPEGHGPDGPERAGIGPALRRLLGDEYTAASAERQRTKLLADWYVSSDIQTNCPAVRLHDSDAVWYDTRPMVDEREHSPEFIDMARICLDHAQSTGLFVQHPVHTYLVRFVRRA